MGLKGPMTGPMRKGDVRSVASQDRGEDWRAAGPSEGSGPKGSGASADRVRHEVAAGPNRRARS